ncbi:MAG: tol-pal system protein YbgF [Desulfosalsimonadaceae bacterium]
MTTSIRRYIFLAAAGCILLSGCATTADVNRLERRVSSLDERNQKLEKRITSQIEQLNQLIEKRKEQDDRLRDLFAGQDAEFYKMRSELRELSGRFEEREHRFSRKLQEMSASLEDNREKLGSLSETVELNDKRISRLAAYLGIESAEKIEAATESGTSGGEAEDKPRSEDKLYGFAKKSFDEQNYETARDAFEKYLETYPDSDKADNARFWIGEIYFNEKWYEKAIVEYEEVIKQYPKGNKVRAAYLKQGIAFEKLGETGNAKLIFKDLIQKHPDSSEAEIAQKKLDKLE